LARKSLQVRYKNFTNSSTGAVFDAFLAWEARQMAIYMKNMLKDAANIDSR